MSLNLSITLLYTTGVINFVDYEDTGFSYAAYDMAYFFCATVGKKCSPHSEVLKIYFTNHKITITKKKE